MDQITNLLQLILNSLQQLDVPPTEKNIDILFGTYRTLKKIKAELENQKPEETSEEIQNDGAEQ